MVKYVKTEQGYMDSSIFAPAPFKPEGKSYLTFSSPKSFTLNLYGKAKHWNGALEYFSADKVWTTWDGTTTLSSVDNDGEHVLYLRGTGNTVITPPSDDDNWILTGYDIQCIGNIENLLDYATVEAGSHPAMGIGCYSAMFRNCKSLTKAPELPATTLANDCYQYMFDRCSSLIQPPALPATTLANRCYQCMFKDCSSLIQPPALPATTLANYCYYSMFSGCSSITQVPALPVTMLANYCYYSMFQGCTSLKLSSTKTGEYTVAYRIPTTGAGSAAANDVQNMFTSTGGTFTGTPAINTTYYLSTDNMIVRDTEVATLNGYVGSMIDNSASNSLNITGATVGQIAKITAVDDSGKPTAWEAVDMPSGGGGETWEAINAITLSDAVNTVTINTDSGGNAIALKKVRILVEGSATGNQDLFFNNSRYIRAHAVGEEASVGAFSAEPFCGKMYCFAVTKISANYGAISQLANTFSDEITITEIKLIVNNSRTFNAGTKFTIQGVRA